MINIADQTPRDCRDLIIDVLRRRLVGPLADDETIPNRAYDTYHTGFLSPARTPVDEEEDDQDTGDSDADTGAAEAIMTLANLSQQGAMGMSFQVDPEFAMPVRLRAMWAEYVPVEIERESQDGKDEKQEPKQSHAKNEEDGKPEEALETGDDKKQHKQTKPRRPIFQWRRTTTTKELVLLRPGEPTPFLEERGIQLRVIDRVQPNARIVTFSVVNNRSRASFPNDNRIYQVQLVADTINSEAVFVARPASSHVHDEEFWNYELLYRDHKELAVGHGCSVDWESEDGRRASRIATCWMPQVEVPKAAANILEGSEFLGLDYLKERNHREAICQNLLGLATAYESWITSIEADVDSAVDEFAPEHRDAVRKVCNENIEQCRTAAERIRIGIACLKEQDAVWEAFCLANEAMARSMLKTRPGRTPTWRAFQLAFILVCLPSSIDSTHDHRKTLDLIWFPTGGGKTEAYFGLAATIIFYRRLVARTSAEADGTAVLTRYTLRLLTIQQFERATKMICACELIRQANPKRLGATRFTCGLFVGNSATPGNLKEAEKVLAGDSGEESNLTTLPLVHCPWCCEKLERDDQRIEDGRLITPCPNSECEFHVEIPIAVVDEEIYGNPPTMVVGTIDKFARMAWEPRIRRLFGTDDNNPPSLIIQDELHLISDALGTLAALYETAIDYLCSRQGSGPKIIGSTATIRRAEHQCHRLFDRKAVQFPPNGLIASNSFFYRNEDVEDSPARLYVGVHAQGRSPKHTLVWTVGTLAQAVMEQTIPDEKLRDPFHTQVLYFNSLRELGGALVLAEDDIPRYLKSIVPDGGHPRRELVHKKELTGQVPSSQIPDMMRDLEKSLHDDDWCREPLDLVFSTNMISVGIDVDRLGLMVVNGQPKTTSEYIQATSRVGRPLGSAGLVITLYNWTRPRDRSHYERFTAYHNAFYRHVESVSVTPFSARARDRALHAVLVAFSRLLEPGLSERDLAGKLADNESLQTRVQEFARLIYERAQSVDPGEAEATRAQLDVLINEWTHQAEHHRDKLLWNKGPFQPQRYAMLRNPDASIGQGLWVTRHSMRDVQAPTPVRILTKKQIEDQF